MRQCAMVRRRANPGTASGEFEVEKLVATPAQALRASMRLYDSGLELAGFVLGLLDFYTGSRWGEQVGQQRHEYDSEARAIQIREPLKEIGGRLFKGGRRIDTSRLADLGPRPTRPVTPRRQGGRTKKGRTKTPAGTRTVELPPSIAVFYVELMDSRSFPFVLCSSEGAPLRRSNFRNPYWRPVWDGSDAEHTRSAAADPAALHLPRGAAQSQPGSPRTVSPRGRTQSTIGSENEGHREGLRPCDSVDAPPDSASDGGPLDRLADRAHPGGADDAGEWFPHLHATFRDGQLETAPNLAIERQKPRPSEEEQGF
ncbi:integrase [Amycolatopsis regifaucium]|uniref:integrase n=1 Tax=Amycolatopsis regifaucium TaxID=546365 RepID=UPI001FC9751A|nr:integrase [Amycolatopsis regifaucium]